MTFSGSARTVPMSHRDKLKGQLLQTALAEYSATYHCHSVCRVYVRKAIMNTVFSMTAGPSLQRSKLIMAQWLSG